MPSEPFISLVIHTIHEVLKDEDAQFHNGVQTQIKNLLSNLDRVRSQLNSRNEPEMQDDEKRIRIFIKDLAYKAQDIVEKYYVKIKTKSGIMKVTHPRLACIPNDSYITSSPQEVEKDLKDISTKLDQLSKKLSSSSANCDPNASAHASSRAPDSEYYYKNKSSANDTHDVLGMDEDINNLVSLVRDDTKGQIVSLYGMYGSGKTAMASKVYHHPEIRKNFDHFAWVCISQNCDHTNVLKQIFEQLTKKKSTDQKTHSQYLEEINAIFKNDKCLIVLDNIWNVTDRDIIFRAFSIPKGNIYKSKILQTTRIEEIASVRSVGVIHHQRLLDAQDGLKLLIQTIRAKVHNSEVKIEKSHEYLGREMVRRCGGVPLAISNLGEILRGQLSVKHWKMINKDIGSTLNQGSGEVDAQALDLSYYGLRPYLKPCFLYMGLFGKDENIELHKLYHLWIAEGIVSEEHRNLEEGTATLMDIAERFLKELSSSCMAQVKKDPILERMESCRLYDQMRGYCLRMAKKEGFLDSVDMDLRGGQIAGVDTMVDDNAKRLAIHMKIDPRDTRCVKPFEQTISTYIRALSFHCVKPMQHPSMSSNVPFFSMGKYTMETSLTYYFKLLKVLDFVDCRFHGKKLPSGIGQLVLLRYLGLRGCNIKELPSSVGDLPLLETLDLRTRGTIEILAANIFLKMKKLRHLYLSNFKCGSGGELQLDGLSQLETLVFEADIYELKVSGLCSLTNIRYFKVNMLWNCKEWESVIKDMENWKKIKRLQVGISMVERETLCLALERDNITDLRLYRISSFMKFGPETNTSCRNLVSLDIIYCEDVNETVIKLVGKFPNLRKLRCSAIKKSIKEINFDKKSFPQLRSLELNDVAELEKLKVEKGSLPNLMKLVVGGCEKLEIVPEDGLKFICMLRELDVKKNTMSVFKERFRRHCSNYEQVSLKEF